MENKYFDINDSLFNISEKYIEVVDLLKSIGIANIEDEKMRSTIGKSISLKNILKTKKISIEDFEAQLIERIENNIKNKSKLNDNAIKIRGVLPCPVKVPLLEAFEGFINESKFDYPLDYELKAASMGVDWIGEEVADIFISAGFDLFFDKKYFGKFRDEGIFEDITDFAKYNEDFDNDYIKLKDPNEQYSMIGVVPAVFLVNSEELKGKKTPTSWKDIISGDYENSVSLPIGDFDLFNAILLNIYKNYGEEGVKNLGKCLKKSMHPSEMVKSHNKPERPAITIMPYFFTKMVKKGGPMLAVWPKDGAIISPIFMLSKENKKEELKPIIDFFASKEVGEILSHNGRFPSVNPDVNNMISKENKYMWLGWDYIAKHDISKLIRKCENIFNSEIKGVEKI